MKIQNSIEAVEIFTNSATENTKLFGAENHKLANKYYKQMKISFEFLIGNSFVDKMLPLLNHQNYGVQLWAASFLATIEKDKVIKTLQKLIDLKIQHISLSAEYTLKGIIEN